MHRAMCVAVDEVGKVSSELGIDCHYAKGEPSPLPAPSRKLERAKDEVAAARELGYR